MSLKMSELLSFFFWFVTEIYFFIFLMFYFSWLERIKIQFAYIFFFFQNQVETFLTGVWRVLNNCKNQVQKMNNFMMPLVCIWFHAFLSLYQGVCNNRWTRSRDEKSPLIFSALPSNHTDPSITMIWAVSTLPWISKSIFLSLLSL